jgi:hypothetical protein
MRNTTTVGVSTSSTFSASPVTKPPEGPIVARAKEQARPVWGRACDISARLEVRPGYITVMTSVAQSSPPKPPTASPRFEPEESPEITAPTPSA